MATIKVTQDKEKDFDIIDPKVGYSDMSDDIRAQIVEVCKESYKLQYLGELKHFKAMAANIKEALDKKLGGSWHIIVGKSVG